MTQESESFTPEHEYVISDLDTLKVIADPFRLQIIEIIFDHAHTVKQIAQKLDLPPLKLYYHINLLEKHGLISITHTRMVSGIMEKSYQASARNFRVKQGLLTPGTTEEGIEQRMDLFVEAILEDAKRDIKQNALSGLIDLSSDNQPHSLRISRTTTRLTDAQALEFQRRLALLVQEFQSHKEQGANDGEQGYALVLAMYPTIRGSRPLDDDEFGEDDSDIRFEELEETTQDDT